MSPPGKGGAFFGPPRLTEFNDFDSYKIMEKHDVIVTLMSLAKSIRLDIYKLLVHASPEGLSPAEIGDALGLNPSATSLHLDHLHRGRLVRRERHGRMLIYSIDEAGLGALFEYLMGDCCHGNPSRCDILLSALERPALARPMTEDHASLAPTAVA